MSGDSLMKNQWMKFTNDVQTLIIRLSLVSVIMLRVHHSSDMHMKPAELQKEQ